MLAEPGEPQEGPLRCLLCEEQGRTLGYMLYTSYQDRSLIEPSVGQRSHRIEIRENVWLSASAYVAMWKYLAAHDLVFRTTFGDAPSDDPLLHFARDPRTLRATFSDGLMVRIVDLERALQIRPYPIEADLTFAIQDDLCPWNAGVWKLSAGPQGAHVRRAETEPELSMDIFTLAHLATGALSATYAHRVGRIEVVDK